MGNILRKKVSIPTQVTNNSRGSIKILSTLRIPPPSPISGKLRFHFQSRPIENAELALKASEKNLRWNSPSPTITFQIQSGLPVQSISLNTLSLRRTNFSRYSHAARQSSFIKGKRTNERKKEKKIESTWLSTNESVQGGKKVCSRWYHGRIVANWPPLWISRSKTFFLHRSAVFCYSSRRWNFFKEPNGSLGKIYTADAWVLTATL